MNQQLTLGTTELFGPSFGRSFTEGSNDLDRRPDPAEVRMWLQSLHCTLWQTFMLDDRGLERATEWFCDALDSFYTWRDTNV